ncbi:CopY/TcrY family copper transport repressor [Streptococcus intermedius]|uniref:CopY/TcrY family copper transport repressor n=1 Tax=Streptococcus intermedius TaxID=1338 RepID=A0A930WE57_STRIT|nr:CopY/TcrY family copper transport repressor [Streptococcus intermedius]MBF1712309.1 CopY/TcrY family copper transport repressor [Streptococcus intermedius]MDK8091530.1 CopY/TcrY family copper transport repressor [Streptococcus intermedius]PMR63955.1 CopY/TcrY family copper transport repressor [Streptococcus intermedius]WOI92096.1 CopY/TcrY family copper transport repressor [Streptococcus intermedius]
MEHQNISQAEWQVMRVLWAYPHIRSTEVIERLETDFAWKPATVKTLLNRLKTKEFISMEKIEGKFYYDALVLEDEHLQNSWRILLDNMCNTKHGDLVISILESNQFSRKDLSRILDVVKEKQVQAPKRVQCNCPPGQCTCGKDCQDEMNLL